MRRHNIGAPRGQMLYRLSRLHHLAEFGVRGHIPYLRRKKVSTRNVFSAVGLVDQDPLLTDVGPLTDIDD